MSVPIPSGYFNASGIEIIRIFPMRAFMYNTSSCYHESNLTGYINLRSSANGTYSRSFFGTANLQWSEGGNFNATIYASDITVGPPSTSMAYESLSKSVISTAIPMSIMIQS